MRAPGELPPVSFEYAEEDRSVTVKTASLMVTVDKITGEVSFMDKGGNVILQENSGGGKSFAPIEVEGDRGYTVRQVLNPDDEAFYGLGQHQSDEFNYKGRNETLYQYNTKVSVPFIVSSKNYGLLWDNNALTRFGNPGDYLQLDVLELRDAEGNEGALTAVYASRDGKTEYLRRRESVIDYTDLEKVKGFPEEIPFHDARISGKGPLRPGKADTPVPALLCRIHQGLPGWRRSGGRALYGLESEQLQIPGGDGGRKGISSPDRMDPRRGSLLPGP